MNNGRQMNRGCSGCITQQVNLGKYKRNIMNALKKSIILGGFVAALTLGAGNHLMAQGRNFDPAQFRQDRIDRAHEQLEIKDDTEWKAMEPIVGKVIDADGDAMAM